jgi:hypothetical protein
MHILEKYGIFETEVVEQCFGAGMAPHHDQQASENGNPATHGRNFSF